MGKKILNVGGKSMIKEYREFKNTKPLPHHNEHRTVLWEKFIH